MSVISTEDQQAIGPAPPSHHFLPDIEMFCMRGFIPMLACQYRTGDHFKAIETLCSGWPDLPAANEGKKGWVI